MSVILSGAQRSRKTCGCLSALPEHPCPRKSRPEINFSHAYRLVLITGLDCRVHRGQEVSSPSSFQPNDVVVSALSPRNKRITAIRTTYRRVEIAGESVAQLHESSWATRHVVFIYLV